MNSNIYPGFISIIPYPTPTPAFQNTDSNFTHFNSSHSLPNYSLPSSLSSPPRRPTISAIPSQPSSASALPQSPLRH